MTSTKIKLDVSDEAIKKATGKSWTEWITILNKEKAHQMEHKDIVTMLREKGYLKNHWWQQTVVVGYEKTIGRRVLGQTKDTGFQLGTQKTFVVSAQRAWEALMSPTGQTIWLGETNQLVWKKGSNYQTKNNVTGEIRIFQPKKRYIRLTWHPKKFDHPSTLQLRVLAKGRRSVISIHQEKLADADTRERMKKHWQNVLKQLQKLLIRES